MQSRCISWSPWLWESFPNLPLKGGLFLWRRKTKLSYQGVNYITVKNMNSLPLINSAFESLENVQIFIKLDLHNAYHLVWIQEGDERKTVFNYPLGHFEYLFMPFGLTNAPTKKISYLLRLRNVSFILTVYFLGICYWGICYWCPVLCWTACHCFCRMSTPPLK